MSIDPTEHGPNKSCLLFQLNDALVGTEQDGDSNLLATMDVATGVITGMEFIGITENEPSEFTSQNYWRWPSQKQAKGRGVFMSILRQN